MTVTCGFFNSVNHDRKYNTEQFGAMFDGIINDGVFATIGTALAVSASSGMTLNVGIGKAWFNRTWTDNDAILPLTVLAAEVVLNRIDVVVLEVDQRDETRDNSIKIIKGTPGSVPVAPTMAQTEFFHQYPLAHIYVGAGVTEISQANITNKIGTSECPLITGILQTINIESLVAQWETEFDEWLDYIKSIFLDDPAGHLQSEIEALNLKFETIVVATSSFVADATYATYGYKAVIPCVGVTADYFAKVIFNPTEATNGNYAPVSLTGTDTVTIYAKAIPGADITILTIFCSKAVSGV